jgi:hypothetical protein
MHNFLRVSDLANGAPIPPISDCATTLPKAKNHSSASFFLSLVRLPAFRGMLSVDFNSGRASKRNFRLKKISENPRYLREIKISSRTTIRSFLTSGAYWPLWPSVLYSEVGFADYAGQRRKIRQNLRYILLVNLR